MVVGRAALGSDAHTLTLGAIHRSTPGDEECRVETAFAHDFRNAGPREPERSCHYAGRLLLKNTQCGSRALGRVLDDRSAGRSRVALRVLIPTLPVRSEPESNRNHSFVISELDRVQHYRRSLSGSS